MSSILIKFYFISTFQLSVGCLIAIAVAQDYQDFGPQPGRPQQAPHRLNSQQLEEQKPTPIPILKQINKWVLFGFLGLHNR